MGRWVVLSVGDAAQRRAFLTVPNRSAQAAVVVCPAAWGVSRHVRRLTEDLAERGFAAIAPNAASALGDRSVVRVGEDDLIAVADAAAEYVIREARGAPLLAIGYDLGGWVATRLSALRRDVVAVATCSGFAEDADYTHGRADAYQLHVPESYGAELQLEEAFLRALERAGAWVDVYRYRDVRAGFFSEDDLENHDQLAADLAWERMLDFLGQATV